MTGNPGGMVTLARRSVLRARPRRRPRSAPAHALRAVRRGARRPPLRAGRPAVPVRRRPAPALDRGRTGARPAPATRRAARPRRDPAGGPHGPLRHALRAGLGASGRRGARRLVGRAARRRAPELTGPPPTSSPPRCSPRRPPVDHTDPPRPQPRVLEQEIMGPRAVGVEGVLCATGDVRARGSVRRHPGLDLDGTRLAAPRRRRGLVATVPEAPEAAPGAAARGRGQAAPGPGSAC